MRRSTVRFSSPIVAGRSSFVWIQLGRTTQRAERNREREKDGDGWMFNSMDGWMDGEGGRGREERKTGG